MWFTGEVLCTPHVQPRVGHNMDISWNCKGIILVKKVLLNWNALSVSSCFFSLMLVQSPTSFPPPLSLPCSFLFVLHLVMLSEKKKKAATFTLVEHPVCFGHLPNLLPSLLCVPLCGLSLYSPKLQNRKTQFSKCDCCIGGWPAATVRALHMRSDGGERFASSVCWSANWRCSFLFFFLTPNSALCGWDLQPVRHCWWPLKWDPPPPHPPTWYSRGKSSEGTYCFNFKALCSVSAGRKPLSLSQREASFLGFSSSSHQLTCTRTLMHAEMSKQPVAAGGEASSVAKGVHLFLPSHSEPTSYGVPLHLPVIMPFVNGSSTVGEQKAVRALHWLVDTVFLVSLLNFMYRAMWSWRRDVSSSGGSHVWQKPVNPLTMKTSKESSFQLLPTLFSHCGAPTLQSPVHDTARC